MPSLTSRIKAVFTPSSRRERSSSFASDIGSSPPGSPRTSLSKLIPLSPSISPDTPPGIETSSSIPRFSVHFPNDLVEAPTRGTSRRLSVSVTALVQPRRSGQYYEPTLPTSEFMTDAERRRQRRSSVSTPASNDVRPRSPSSSTATYVMMRVPPIPAVSKVGYLFTGSTLKLKIFK